VQHKATWRYRKKDTDTKHVTVYKNINRHGATDFFKEKSNVRMCTKTWTDMVLQKKKIHWHKTCDCVQKHEQTWYYRKNTEKNTLTRNMWLCTKTWTDSIYPTRLTRTLYETTTHKKQAIFECDRTMLFYI